jgi:hypothetical protein
VIATVSHHRKLMITHRLTTGLESYLSREVPVF